jgi:hypothetical protein
LNASVSVNGQRVEDLSFSLGVPAVAQAPAPESAAPAAARAPESPPSAARARAPAPDAPDGFRPVRVVELERYMNRYVRLHEQGQSPREGTLVQMSGGNAVLERAYGTGHIVVKVPLARVNRAEVQF